MTAGASSEGRIRQEVRVRDILSPPKSLSYRDLDTTILSPSDTDQEFQQRLYILNPKRRMYTYIRIRRDHQVLANYSDRDLTTCSLDSPFQTR